jgi:hypothetical protein
MNFFKDIDRPRLGGFVKSWFLPLRGTLSVTNLSSLEV